MGGEKRLRSRQPDSSIVGLLTADEISSGAGAHSYIRGETAKKTQNIPLGKKEVVARRKKIRGKARTVMWRQ